MMNYIFFGFSRGAAIARRFAVLLENIFISMGKEFTPKIKFLGVFDTVAAINKPNLFNVHKKPVSDVVFENYTIAPIIETALHLVALDERRIAFQPTLMNKEDKVTEIWFPGAHADVGGGFRFDGLSDGALQFMLEWLENKKFGLTILDPSDVDYANLSIDTNVKINIHDILIQPNHLGKSHQQRAITGIKAAFLDHRNLRVNKRDKICTELPVLHRSVIDRIYEDTDYRPEPLAENNRRHPYTGKLVGHKVYGIPTDFTSLKDHLSYTRAKTLCLAVGEVSDEITVFANQLFSPSGILMEQCGKYRFVLDFTQKWFDASIDCGPRGWQASEQTFPFYKKWLINLIEDHRRLPVADWFELIASVGKKVEHQFQLLHHIDQDYSPPITGELYCYPNDLINKYSNNLGLVKLKVHRTA